MVLIFTCNVHYANPEISTVNNGNANCEIVLHLKLIIGQSYLGGDRTLGGVGPKRPLPNRVVDLVSFPLSCAMLPIL